MTGDLARTQKKFHETALAREIIPFTTAFYLLCQARWRANFVNPGACLKASQTPSESLKLYAPILATYLATRPKNVIGFMKHE